MNERSRVPQQGHRQGGQNKGSENKVKKRRLEGPMKVFVQKVFKRDPSIAMNALM